MKERALLVCILCYVADTLSDKFERNNYKSNRLKSLKMSPCPRVKRSTAIATVQIFIAVFIGLMLSL